MMMIRRSIVAWSIAISAFNCAASDPTTDDSEHVEEGEPGGEPAQGEEVVLAQINTGGGTVVWVAPENPEDEPEVVITMMVNETPILAPDFVDDVGPIAAYLAMVDSSDALPEALAPFASDADLEMASSIEMRIAVRSKSEALIAKMSAEIAEANANAPDLIAAGCTANQRNSARSFYGAAYSSGGGSSGSKTCGDHIAGFHNKDGDTFYCNNVGGDCDFLLDNGSAQCDPDLGCSFVRGQTRSRRVRGSTSPESSYSFNNYGRRFRFGYMNCSLSSTAAMRRKRGSDSWITTNVAPNTMQIRVGGQSNPGPSATARSNVKWAAWHTHQNYGTNANPMNRFELLQHSNGYFCGDIIQRFDTYDETSVSCGSGQRLCDDNSCSNDGCWD